MMGVIQLLFLVATLFGMGIIVLTRNVVHSVYALALVLVSLAGIYVTIHAELLAVVQLLLYAGGVVMLMVFGVMMTTRLKGNKLLTESRNKILAFLISASIFAGLVYSISTHEFETEGNLSTQNQLKEIGISFITDHLVAFELVAFTLLVALVGASYLAKMSSNE